MCIHNVYHSTKFRITIQQPALHRRLVQRMQYNSFSLLLLSAVKFKTVHSHMYCLFTCPPPEGQSTTYVLPDVYLLLLEIRIRHVPETRVRVDQLYQLFVFVRSKLFRAHVNCQLNGKLWILKRNANSRSVTQRTQYWALRSVADDASKFSAAHSVLRCRPYCTRLVQLVASIDRHYF